MGPICAATSSRFQRADQQACVPALCSFRRELFHTRSHRCRQYARVKVRRVLVKGLCAHERHYSAAEVRRSDSEGETEGDIVMQ